MDMMKVTNVIVTMSCIVLTLVDVIELYLIGRGRV